MNRLVIACAVAFAAAAASVPAVAGLTNNPSFSHRVPVRVPSQARVVHLDDHGKVVNAQPSEHPTSTAVTSPTRSPEPEPGEDRGTSTAPTVDRGPSTSPADDRGTASEPRDDSGGHGGGSRGGGRSSGHG